MIGLELNKKNFEYDTYALIRAFYPKAEIEIIYTGEAEKNSYEKLFQVTYETDQVTLVISNQDGEITFRKTVEFNESLRKKAKNQIKQLFYGALAQETQRTLPWGNLTGIRPTKIPMALLEEGMTNVEAADYMRTTYQTNNAKTALSITIANRERDILKDIDYQNGYSLYVGIPFCPSICLYCSFSSYPLKQWETQVDDYLTALCKELTFISKAMQGRTLDTIYIGGGTPTTLEPGQLSCLLQHLQKEFDTRHLKEYTIEAGRPDSITKEKLEVIRNFPVTRISVNPQTMNQVTLDIIGRKHTVEDTQQAFALARELGFDNINMDLIIGLPGESKEDVHHTLEAVKALRPDSLTVHSLAVKRAARLTIFKEKYKEMTFENNQEIMDMTMDYAHQMNMGPYYLYRQKNMTGNLENIGYAKEGCAGIYNILIMEEKQPIIAAGAGAATKLVFDGGKRIERVENVKDVTHYLARVDEMIERKRIAIEKYL